LSNGNLKEETWNSDKEEHEEVGDQKCSTSMLETEVGKTPHIAKT
jgi:hypothetical protein